MPERPATACGSAVGTSGGRTRCRRCGPLRLPAAYTGMAQVINRLRHRGIGMTSPRARERLTERLRGAGIRHPRVLRAIGELPRHIFVDEALASRAYEDSSLPIGHGQTLSQPYIVARMTEVFLQGGPLDTVLEVGTGSGYQTAVLASLFHRVYSVERIEPLLCQARERLRGLHFRNVRFKHCDGGMGLPEYAPFDGIVVTAAPEGIPRTLVNQLVIGGRMVLPIGRKGQQVLVRVTRTAVGYEHEILERVSFVPLVGGVSR